jgi:hypothetical protein
MSARNVRKLSRTALACASLGVCFTLAGCASDGYDGGSSSVSVGYGYGGYYGSYYDYGYYDPYPPVIVDVPDERPDRPDRPDSGNRPSTLPSDVGGASTRPSSASRPTSRPSPRPAPRPMPRGGGGRRR